MISNEDDSIKEPAYRSIINLVNYNRASGKSSFFKFFSNYDE